MSDATPPKQGSGKLLASKEYWLPIVEYEGTYEVSNEGRIRRILPASGAFLSVLNPIKDGKYLYVNLSSLGIAKKVSVHILVCRAFHGEKPSKYHHAAHGDGDPHNNHEKNLRWATPYQNYLDSIAHGTKIWGEKSHYCKLQEKDIFCIRYLYKNGYSQTDLSHLWKVSQANISAICNRKIWAQLPIQDVLLGAYND